MDLFDIEKEITGEELIKMGIVWEKYTTSRLPSGTGVTILTRDGRLSIPIKFATELGLIVGNYVELYYEKELKIFAVKKVKQESVDTLKIIPAGTKGRGGIRIYAKRLLKVFKLPDKPHGLEFKVDKDGMIIFNFVEEKSENEKESEDKKES